jgi:single-strand DNA-binding protein
MATDLNLFQCIGRLGKDVELKTMKNGESMALFSVAVNDSYMSKTGEKVQNTEWINVVCYRKLAEICAKYLVKGSHIYLSGKFKSYKYEKDGIEKLAFQIVMENMQMLGQKEVRDPVVASEPAKNEHAEFDSDIPF